MSESRSGSPSQPGIATGPRKSHHGDARSTQSEKKLDVRSSSPRPPNSSEKPRTSSRLPTTRPVSEPRTTSVSPLWTAISAMISSGAFPKVAFRKPPIPGPVCSAACSVASPISQASGISAIAESANSAVVPDVRRCSGAR